jgi:sugar phosphate isomerase/epimerase
MHNKRRQFIIHSGRLLAGLTAIGLSPTLSSCQGERKSTAEEKEAEAQNLMYGISLAQWSLHRTINKGELDNLDFAAKARKDFGIDAVEYVNQFFFEKATDMSYLAQMKQRAGDHGVQSLLIMIDREGALGDIDEKSRTQAVENHYKWIEAAHYLGCHSIRVNAGGNGTPGEVADAAITSLGQLCEYGAQDGIGVIVENHGGYSSDGAWLANVIRAVDVENCGTLPDFGNFCIERGEVDGKRVCVNEYDRYQGMRDLIPYAKGVSAKSYAFNEAGEETTIDFARMLQIVHNAGFEGYIGIEYEGSELPEDEGIKATKRLLVETMQAMS